MDCTCLRHQTPGCRALKSQDRCPSPRPMPHSLEGSKDLPKGQDAPAHAESRTHALSRPNLHDTCPLQSACCATSVSTTKRANYPWGQYRTWFSTSPTPFRHRGPARDGSILPHNRPPKCKLGLLAVKKPLTATPGLRFINISCKGVRLEINEHANCHPQHHWGVTNAREMLAITMGRRCLFRALFTAAFS